MSAVRFVTMIGVTTGLALTVVATDAATPLTELKGQWSGRGTDRNSLFGSPQGTRCHATLKTDGTHLTDMTECNGEAGLHKSIHLSIVFSGERFTGKVEQLSTVRGATPTRYAGTVMGQRNGDVADFTAQFGGMTPSAHVVFKINSPTAYSMAVSVLGTTLTDVTLHKR